MQIWVFPMTHPLWTHHLMYLHAAFWVMVPHLILAPFLPKFLVDLSYDLYYNEALVTNF